MRVANSDERSTLLLLGIVPYESIRQRPQWLAEGLARHARVLYVDPHRSLLRRAGPAPGLRHEGDALSVLVPPRALPITGYLRPLNRLSARRTAHAIRAALAELGWPAPRHVLATFPKHLDVASHFPEASLAYDVMDDYPRFFTSPQREVLERMHVELLGVSAVVTASSQTLAQRIAPHVRSPVTVIANAVSSSFVAACKQATPAPELAPLPRPLFGYVGTLGRWFDFEAVRTLARAFPEGSVVLIGPAEVALPRLPPNVHWLGVRPHDELPALLKAFDAGLVPFVPSPLIEAVNPVKVYEYLAAGLFVLGTEFAELKRFGADVASAPAEQWAHLYAQRDRSRAAHPPEGERWEARADQLWGALTGGSA